MEFLGFSPCKADPDVWMRKAKRKDNTDYWEYLLCYVDDTLAISESPRKILEEEIGKYFQMKEGSIGPPKIYLGGTCSKITVNGIDC